MKAQCLSFVRGAIAAGMMLASVSAGGRDAQAETLADALVSAYNHSGLLDQNRALLRAADEDVVTALSTLRPVLRWSASLTQNFGRIRTSGLFSNTTENDDTTAAIALIGELVLYDFGARQFRAEAAKETVLATRHALVDIEQQVLLRAIAAYMGVIEASEFVALRDNNVRLLTQELRAARDRFEVGEITRTDVSLAEARLAEARSGQAAAQGDLLRAIEEYRNVVGRAPGKLTQPPGLPDVGSDVDAAKALAVRTHPNILSARHQVKAADLLTSAAGSDMMPTVNLTGQISIQENLRDSDFNRVGSIGLQAGQIIYQGGALSAAERQARARKDAQRANLHVVRHNVQQDVGNAYASLSSVQAQLAASERQVRAATIAFRGVREEAALGARTTLDVLDAEQSLLDAQSLQVSARANLYVAAYNVLAARGQLTVKNLKLPVVVYDPVAYYDLVKDGPAKRSAAGVKLERILPRYSQ
jgi:outer membrane protein